MIVICDKCIWLRRGQLRQQQQQQQQQQQRTASYLQRMQLKPPCCEFRDFYRYFMWTCIENCNNTREAADRDNAVSVSYPREHQKTS
jgi:hypothetical protein